MVCSTLAPYFAGSRGIGFASCRMALIFAFHQRGQLWDIGPHSVLCGITEKLRLADCEATIGLDRP
jgi:hypothetical protein